MNSLDTQSITHCAHAFALNEAVIGKPSIGSVVFATMLLPLPAIAIIFQHLMVEALITFLLMYLSHLRARLYRHWNGTNCFGHSKQQLMDCCTNQLKFKS